MTTTPAKHVLAIGLKSANPGDNVPLSPAAIQEAAQREVASLKSQNNIVLTPYFVDQSLGSAVEELREKVLADVRPLLRERTWDGVAVGNGVRGNPALTLLFEGVINCVLEEVRPAPRMTFPVHPGEMGRVVRRGFGIGEE